MKSAALVVGVNRYEDPLIRPLEYAERDAVDLAGFLRHAAGYDEVVPLVGADCEDSRILQTAARLKDSLEPGGLLVFFFAGHGMELQGRHLLLCPQARLNRLEFFREVVPLDLLKEDTSRPDITRVFILDACRTNRLKARDVGGEGFRGTATLRDVVVVSGGASRRRGALSILCSCDDGLQALEVPQLGRGLFSSALIAEMEAAIRERQEVRVTDDFKLRLRDRMRRIAGDYGLVSEQRPWLQNSDEPPVILAGREPTRPPALPAPDPRPVELKPRVETPRQEDAVGKGDADMERRNPVLATKELPWENSLGMRFVPVAGTKVLFSIWETRVKDYAAYAAEIPGVDGSRRNPEYEGQKVTPSGDCPVVMVSWEDAKAFCEWLTRKERKAGRIGDGACYRLPTDEEWSWAVGVGDREQGKTPQQRDQELKGVFPWGDQWPPPPGAGNFADLTAKGVFTTFRVIEGYEDGHAATSPVGSFAANAQGLYDLSGNVWEFCEYPAGRAPQGRLLRGGCWRNELWSNLLVACRVYCMTKPRDVFTGFRCVLESSRG